MKDVEVSGQLVEMARKASGASGLTIERTLVELARVAYDDGTMIPIAELSADQAAAVASVELTGDAPMLASSRRRHTLEQVR